MGGNARPWRIGLEEMALEVRDGALHQPLPAELGVGQTVITPLDGDLSYIETRYATHRDLAVASRVEPPEPRLVLTLAMRGTSVYCSKAGDEVTFREGLATITTFASSLGERRYRAAQPIVQLRFALTRRWLDAHVGEGHCARLFDKGVVRVLSQRPVSNTARLAARLLLDGNGPQRLGRVFAHGQSLSILAAELSCLLDESPPSRVRSNPRDVAAANLARDILCDEYRSPPTVGQLARRVGINEFKLKQLFHALFDTTPYGLLLEVRMQQAYRLLESTHCPVGVAAHAVGYGHASNFSTAFSKYFGVSPKHVRKKG